MSSFINQITSPVGVRLFKNGPYSDAGHGDQALAAQGQSNDVMKKLIAQISAATGVQNPFALQNPINPDQPQDPFSLNSGQQNELNREQGLTSEGYNKVLSKVKANLSARGFGDSSSMAAAEAHLRGLAQQQLGTQNAMAGQNAYNSRLNSINNIGNMVSGNANQNVNLQQNLGQQATQNSQNSLGQLGSLIGFATGGGFGGGGGGAKAGQSAGGAAGGAFGSPGTPYGPTPNGGNIDNPFGHNWGQIGSIYGG